MYKFYLQEQDSEERIEIPEPIGWDGIELVLKRNEKSHGIDVQYSELSLKFYGDTAINILENSYNDNIDNLITFICENNGTEEYRGKLDFEAYNKVYEDGYCYIEAKAADIGIQVLFNNRIDQKVDLDSLKSFDSEEKNLTDYPMLKQNIDLPSKEITLWSKIIPEEFFQYVTFTTYTKDTVYQFIPEHHKIIVNDFDVMYSTEFTITNNTTFQEMLDSFMIFKYLLDKSVTIGNTFLTILMDFKMINIHKDSPFDPPMYFTDYHDVKLNIRKNDTVIYTETLIDANPMNRDFDVLIQDRIIDVGKLNNNDILYLYFSFQNENVEVNNPNEPPWNANSFSLKINKSEISVSTLSRFRPTIATVSFLHETLSRIAESITNNQITVKTDYYGRTDSNVNKTKTNGIGSFRALSTGLRIRNITVKDENNKQVERLFTLSFSDIIKNLTAIDNIGFGFVKEDEKWFIHVENWYWFYKNDEIFSIRNPNKIERGINPNQIFSIFKSGYKKYETESINGLDAFHTEREYRTRLKLKNNEMEQKSDFIADGYPIEYTRRQSLNNTSDWRYDNDVFIFCLSKNYSVYKIDLGAEDTENTIISPDTIYNMRISPARMINRWLNRLLSLGFGKEESLIFTSGTGNLQAKGRAIIDILGSEYPDTDVSLYNENQNFKSSDLVLLPELIKVSDYPVSTSEYKSIKDNPYGIILVDDIPCFIYEFKYKKQKNTASFVLIPKKV